MMRSRRPWWAVLTAATLVLASLLAPMEGAAYRIVGLEPGGVDRGEPDNPGEDSPQPALARPSSSTSIVLLVQPLPGFLIQFRIPSRLAMRLTSFRRSFR